MTFTGCVHGQLLASMCCHIVVKSDRRDLLSAIYANASWPTKYVWVN